MTEPESWQTQLAASGRDWIQEALLGWVDGNHNKVVVLAPIAVEHLGKAALWSKSPVLLAILDKSKTGSFVKLATKPDLHDPQMRTIGLTDVLSRLGEAFGEVLLPEGRQKRLVEARGGAIHAGQADSAIAQHVLTDALTVFVGLAKHLQLDRAFLFGAYAVTADRLLDRARTEKQRIVDRALDQATLKYEQFVESVGWDLLSDVIAQREATQFDGLMPKSLRWASVEVERGCPVCTNVGRLVGETVFESFDEVDELNGPHGYSRRYVFDLIPQGFYCNVCWLTLADAQELQLADLPHQPFTLDDSDLTPEMQRQAHQMVAEYLFPDDSHADDPPRD